MPWILFFFLGGAAVLASGSSKSSSAKSRFTDARKEGIKLAKFSAIKDPNFMKDLSAGSPYRLVDVYAIGKRLVDYSFQFNGLVPPADVPFTNEGQAIRNAWTLEQYLGSVLKTARNRLDDYAGLDPMGAWRLSKDDAKLGRDEQTRARAIILNVICPILAGRIPLGPHPSVKQTGNLLGLTGNVGPVGSDRTIWNPWAPLRRYMNKDLSGGTLAQQDFVRSITTWLGGYFMNPGTACYYADPEGKMILIPWQSGWPASTDSNAWRKGQVGWRYSRDPVNQSAVLDQLYNYFRWTLDAYCANYPEAKPSACDTVSGLNSQWIQPLSREQEARYLDEAGRAQVYAEGNIQRLDVLGTLVVSLYAPRAIQSFDWSMVVRIVLSAVAIVVQVAPGIGQVVGGVIAAGLAVTNAAIGFVKAAINGGADAQRMAMAFGAGIIDVLQKASLLTKGDLEGASKVLGEARKVAGLSMSTYDQIQLENYGGAYASGTSAYQGAKQTAEDAKKVASDVGKKLAAN